jgi:hypothetical protein
MANLNIYLIHVERKKQYVTVNNVQIYRVILEKSEQFRGLLIA